MRYSLLVAVAAVTMLGWFVPQPSHGQAVASRTMPRYSNPMGQSLSWLLNPQIIKELDIVPEQKEKLTKLRTETSTKMRGMYKSFGDIDPKERQKKYYEAYKELGEETEKKVREVLVDHQIDRLKQIMLQMKLRGAGYGSANALSGDDIAKALELTDEQKEQLRKKEAEVRKEMQAKTQEFYKKLREEGREEIFSVLTDVQRKKLKKLLGEKYEWQATQWRGGQGGAVKKP